MAQNTKKTSSSRSSGGKKTAPKAKAADQTAAQLGIDEVYSELLPADKVEKVEELIQKKSEKEKLAFVGDGINDAPVLSRADIGIAMGAMGSDAAIEAIWTIVPTLRQGIYSIPSCFISLSFPAATMLPSTFAVTPPPLIS